MIQIKNKIYINWDDIKNMVNTIIDNIANENIRKIVAISKGGFVPATIIANKLNVPVYAIGIKSYDGMVSGEIKEYQSLPDDFDFADTLIIDDIVDTGKTIYHIIDKYKIKTSTVIYALVGNDNSYYWSSVIDKKDDNWYIFPWEQ